MIERNEGYGLLMHADCTVNVQVLSRPPPSPSLCLLFVMFYL